jgi:penicillin-binding protein 1A
VVRREGRWPRWVTYTIRGLLTLIALLVIWLAFTAPLSRSLQPLGAPSLTVLSAEGEVIARKGSHIAEPVDVTRLPPHVAQAFIAVEDKRFFRHLGVDPWGLGRAMMRNVSSGSTAEGGSTITQQLAKTSFTGADRTAFRKVQEAFIAVWLEAWLSKEEILSRYLSNVYFGDNVYGLRAASQHYFSVEPERLSLEQAAMLAAVVNAPSRLAPTRHLRAAQGRAALVISRMRQAGFLTERQARAVRPARLRVGASDDTPTGTYFADWVLNAAGEEEEDDSYGEREIRTTLEIDLQRQAERVIRTAGLGRSQAALVAMRTDGRIVAMVGGRDYNQNAFNRATQARRQPGSTFKLFVYLAALRSGLRPETPIDDTPLRIGNWSPQNYGRRYSGRIALVDAFAQSSNVATVRLAQQVGLPEVIRAARDLGVQSPIEQNPSMPLGTAGVSLLEMTAAYAAVAADGYPVRPYGLADDETAGSAQPRRREPAFATMRSLLNAVTTRGTGTGANLAIPTYGKTGTTQDYRDALFIGFAGDLVVGVWVGNDDNSPLPGVTGGSVPTRIWRNFMTGALGTQPQAASPQPQAGLPADTNGVIGGEPTGNEAAPVDELPPGEVPFTPEPALPPPGTRPTDDEPEPEPDDDRPAPAPFTPERAPDRPREQAPQPR